MHNDIHKNHTMRSENGKWTKIGYIKNTTNETIVFPKPSKELLVKMDKELTRLGLSVSSDHSLA